MASDTERLDFMLNHRGKFAGGVTAFCGDDTGTEARIEWEGWDSYGRHGHFITYADDKRTALDLAVDESRAMRLEDWEEIWPEWMLTYDARRARRPNNVTSYERYQERQENPTLSVLVPKDGGATP